MVLMGIILYLTDLRRKTGNFVMLKRLFLSIIILSALASETGAYYSADLMNLYLTNLSQFDMIQDSRNAVSFGVQKQNSSTRLGIPASFYKAISQDAIDAKNPIKSGNSETWFLSALSIGLLIIAAGYLYNETRSKIYFKSAFLSISDSSPPVNC